jgi:eukaryotic-like serine/threonine-protein kinase
VSDLLLGPGDFFAGQKFKIVKLLGKGGMSEVYEAQRLSHGGHVALKILAAPYALRGDFVSRLQAESVFYSVLAHPHIVRMLDADQEELMRRVYIVMELLKGKTLRQLLMRHGSLKWEYVLYILNQLADAMTFAHSKGILHRDLKPENLMLSTDPANKGHLWVLDFGIAKWTDNRVDTGALPQMGTARYMSPEQVKSLWTEHRNIKIDGRSDIYTFGVIAYESLTGRHHFIDDRCPPPVEVILNGHLTAEIVPIQDLAPACPDALAAIIEKCLEKDRDKRYPGMRELWDDLTSFRVSMPAEHPLAKMMAESKRLVARRRVFASAAELTEDAEEVAGARHTAPMPDSFTPPLTPLPFNTPAPLAAPARPFLGQSHTEPLPPMGSAPSPSPPGVAPKEPVIAPAHASSPQPPTSSTPWVVWVGEREVEPIEPDAEDDAAASVRGQLVPSSSTVQAQPAPAPSSRGAASAHGQHAMLMLRPAPAPRVQYQPPSAPVQTRPAPVALPPRAAPEFRRTPGAQTVAKRPSGAWRDVPAYVLGPAAGLGLAVTGAVAILIFVRAPGAGQAAEHPVAVASGTSMALPTSAPEEPNAAPALPSAAPAVTASAPPASPSAAPPPAASSRPTPAQRPATRSAASARVAAALPAAKVVIPLVDDEPTGSRK